MSYLSSLFASSSKGAGAFKPFHHQCRLCLWTHQPRRRSLLSSFIIAPSAPTGDSISFSTSASSSLSHDSWDVGATTGGGTTLAVRRDGAGPVSRHVLPPETPTPTLRPNHAAKSNRQSFRSVPVEASVLQYIQKVGVGIPSRRKRKRNRPNRSDYRPYIVLPDVYSNRTDPIPPPPPFGHNSRVRAVASLGSAADLAPYLHVDEQPIQRSARSGGSSEGSRSGSRTRTTSPTSRVVAEVALAGRSNVGKSTLLNALLYGNKQRPNNANTNKGLGKGPDKAVMSPRPGETRQITLYHISSSPRPPALSSSDTQSKADDESSSPSPSSSRGSSSLRVADLPGYGFAYSGTDDKEELVKRYVLGRDPRALKRLLLLVDARHGLKQSDVDFLMRLQAEKSPEQEEEYVAPGGGGGKSAKQRQKRRGRRRPGGGGSLPPVQIVLTKCDLVPQADLARRVTLVRRQLADILRRETGNLPVMLVAARSTLLPPSPRSRGGPGAASPPRRRDGVLELQRELAALVAPTRR